MTLQQLEYIDAVFRFRHFAKAAEYCGVTQPTLSAMIQKLEAELDVKLFERSSQQVLPTSIGTIIVNQARRVLYEAKQLKNLVAEEKSSLAGTFRLGILPTIAPYLIPRFFPKLCESHPEMDVRVVEMKTDEIKMAITNNVIDAAILVNLDNLENFDISTLYFEQFFAYVSRNDALFSHKSIKTADLNNEFLWLLDEGHCFRDQLVKFCNLKGARESKEAYTLGSIETFMRIVESGKGVTFIPELALDQLNEQQRSLVRSFAMPIPTREIVMMTAKSFVRKSARNLLIESVRQCVHSRMLKLNNTEQRI